MDWGNFGRVKPFFQKNGAMCAKIPYISLFFTVFFVGKFFGGKETNLKKKIGEGGDPLENFLGG